MKRYVSLFEMMTSTEMQRAFKNGQTNLNYVGDNGPWYARRWKQEALDYGLNINYKIPSKHINNKSVLHSGDWRVVLLDSGTFWCSPMKALKGEEMIHSHLLLAGINQGITNNIGEQEFRGWYKRTPKDFVCLSVRDGKLSFAESYLTDFGILDDLSFMKHFNISKIGFKQIEPVVVK